MNNIQAVEQLISAKQHQTAWLCGRRVWVHSKPVTHHEILQSIYREWLKEEGMQHSGDSSQIFRDVLLASVSK